MKRILISAAIVMTVLGSCTKDIEYTGPASAPMLILNSVTCSGNVPSVTLSVSTPFLQSYNSNNIIKSGATVMIGINGIEAPATYVDSLSSYCDSRILQEGDIITVTATYPDYGTATATDTVPYSQSCTISRYTKEYVPVKSWDDVIGDQYYGYINPVDSTWVIGADINVPDSRCYYYFMTVEPTMTYQRLTPQGIDTIVMNIHYTIPTPTRIMLGMLNGTQDIQDAQASGSLEFGMGSFIFSGQNLEAGNPLNFEVLMEQPDTLDYRITYNADGEFMGFESYSIADSIIGEPKYRTDINLYVLSENYYYYHKSVNDFNQSDADFLTEPVTIIHNVKGGAGLVGTYSSSSYSIDY